MSSSGVLSSSRLHPSSGIHAKEPRHQLPQSRQLALRPVQRPAPRLTPSAIAAEDAPTTTGVPLRAAGSRTPWWLKSTAPNMVDVTNVQQLVNILAENREKLVVIDCYARWCNACKALYPRLVKVATEHQDSVVVVKLNWDDNKDLCKRLGIKVMPMFLFYRGTEGCVARFSCNLGKWPQFMDALQLHTTPRCSLGSLGAPLQEYPDVFPDTDTAAQQSSSLLGNNVVAVPSGTFAEQLQPDGQSTLRN